MFDNFVEARHTSRKIDSPTFRANIKTKPRSTENSACKCMSGYPWLHDQNPTSDGEYEPETPPHTPTMKRMYRYQPYGRKSKRQRTLSLNESELQDSGDRHRFASHQPVSLYRSRSVDDVGKDIDDLFWKIELDNDHPDSPISTVIKNLPFWDAPDVFADSSDILESDVLHDLPQFSNQKAPENIFRRWRHVFKEPTTFYIPPKEARVLATVENVEDVFGAWADQNFGDLSDDGDYLLDGRGRKRSKTDCKSRTPRPKRVMTGLSDRPGNRVFTIIQHVANFIKYLLWSLVEHLVVWFYEIFRVEIGGDDL